LVWKEIERVRLLVFGLKSLLSVATHFKNLATLFIIRDMGAYTLLLIIIKAFIMAYDMGAYTLLLTIIKTLQSTLSPHLVLVVVVFIMIISQILFLICYPKNDD